VEVTAVVFDVGGVLEVVDDMTWLDRWRVRAGLDPAEADLRSRYAGELGLDDAATDAFMADLWDWYCGRLDTELMTWAAALRPTFGTAILSNSVDGARREEQQRYDFAARFDPIVYSHEVGLAKPDPAVFALTAELVGAAPGQLVLLDDVAANVEAARAAGLQAVLHRDTAASIAAVDALLGR
jgi:putative hydrolase of the HAD superfamily